MVFESQEVTSFYALPTAGGNNKRAPAPVLGHHLDSAQSPRFALILTSQSESDPDRVAGFVSYEKIGQISVMSQLRSTGGPSVDKNAALTSNWPPLGYLPRGSFIVPALICSRSADLLNH
jgi:hypothetical protein